MYPFAQTTDHSLAFAGVCFLTALLGAVVGLVYGWPYTFDRVWFYVWFAVALYFFGRRALKWWQEQLAQAKAQLDAQPDSAMAVGDARGVEQKSPELEL